MDEQQLQQPQAGPEHGKSCYGGRKKEEGADVKPCGESNHAGNSSSSSSSPASVYSSFREDNNPLCLAVIRENGTDLVVFDAGGQPRTFRYRGDVRKLCFSSHGNAGLEDLLTPCFDEQGNHGDPDESCFCGVDVPHLHAHVRNPRTCGADDGHHDHHDHHGHGQGGLCHQGHHGGSSNERDVALLASQVLLPVPAADALSSGASTASSTAATTNRKEKWDGTAITSTTTMAPLLSFPVSDQMPKQCNGPDVKQQLEERGMKWRGINRHRRRIHQVQHDDHVDYLVHDSRTGSLHLSYPCNDCGLEDVHGTFANVARRKISRKKESEAGDVHLHFFQVDPVRPFSLVEHLQSLFQTYQSDRVAAATHLLSSPDHHRTGAGTAPDMRSTLLTFPPPTPATAPTFVAPPSSTEEKAGRRQGRTVLCVEGICCASEVPIVRSILEPLKGVGQVKVNPTTKLVYVTHSPDLITSHQLSSALTHEGFPSEIRVNAKAMSGGGGDGAGSAFVRSLLSLELEATAKKTTAAARSDGDDKVPPSVFDVPDTEALAQLLRGYDASQMESFVVDVPAHTVTVVHNPFALSIQAIAAAVQKETGIPTAVVTDGADPETWDYLKEWDSSAESTWENNLDVDEGRTYPRPTVILCGICWIISMLHYIGGNWCVCVLSCESSRGSK
jgi:copper chaperone CopZ